MSIAGSGRAVHNGGDPFSSGQPPLIWWGGPVMGTAAAGPVVVTPIFWSPPGPGQHEMNGDYERIITKYMTDVAAASGSTTNVFSVPTEYYDSTGSITYNVKVGKPIDDKQKLPANGCTVAANDTTGIYADGTGYNACLDDDQITGEIQRLTTMMHLPQNDYSHIYVMYTPKHVETCFYPGSSVTNNGCSINHQVTAAYCAYHSMMGPNWPVFGTIYANMAYPIYASGTGFTCGSDAGGFLGGLQSPNHNLDADTEVSPSSHEIESITDPNVYNGWFDDTGFEIGDDCAYVWGAVTGKQGQKYNQTINGQHYLTQEELSNKDFADTGGGCVPSSSAVG